MPISLNQRSLPKPLSWNLNIDSTIVVVNSSMTIGSVMVQLVNRLDVSQDFSDYALWWSKTNTWLTNTKWTLDQYGVQSDAQLNFTSMHKLLRLQLPDLRILSLNADFSVSVSHRFVNFVKSSVFVIPKNYRFFIQRNQPIQQTQLSVEHHHAVDVITSVHSIDTIRWAILSLITHRQRQHYSLQLHQNFDQQRTKSE